MVFLLERLGIFALILAASVTFVTPLTPNCTALTEESDCVSPVNLCKCAWCGSPLGNQAAYCAMECEHDDKVLAVCAFRTAPIVLASFTIAALVASTVSCIVAVVFWRQHRAIEAHKARLWMSFVVYSFQITLLVYAVSMSFVAESVEEGFGPAVAAIIIFTDFARSVHLLVVGSHRPSAASALRNPVAADSEKDTDSIVVAREGSQAEPHLGLLALSFAILLLFGFAVSGLASTALIYASSGTEDSLQHILPWLNWTLTLVTTLVAVFDVCITLWKLPVSKLGAAVFIALLVFLLVTCFVGLPVNLTQASSGGLLRVFLSHVMVIAGALLIAVLAETWH